MSFIRLQRRVRRTLCLFSWALLFGVPSGAQVVLVPPGLTPGTTYRLVYVTSDTRNAIPTDIAVYDAFVQNQSDVSNIGLGSPIGDITWKAIGSTASVNAITHVAAAGGIYRLDGALVAGNAAGLWDGTLDSEINVDDEGANREVSVYTGTDSAGFGASAGATPVRLGDSSARLGNSGEVDAEWVETGFFSSAAIGRAFYAISDPLMVPTPQVPAVSRVGSLAFALVMAMTAFGAIRLRTARL